MNIGDGLTIQTRSINGKVSTGIFLAPSNVGKEPKSKFSYKSKTGKYPIRSRVEPTQTGQGIGNRGKASDKVTNNTVTRSQENKQTKPPAEGQSKQGKGRKSQDGTEIPLSNQQKKDDAPIGSNVKPKVQKPQRKPNVSDAKKLKNAKNTNAPEESPNASSKFVTLTQDQLNTILSLVKTKHDIDVSTVLTEKDQNTTKPESNGPNPEENPERVEPDSVPGLDLDTKSDDGTTKNDEGKGSSEKVSNLVKKATSKSGKVGDKAKTDDTTGDNVQTENKAPDETEMKNDQEVLGKIPGYEACGALGGFGSREREKSKLEAERQEWIKGLVEQVKHTEQMREEKKQKRKGSERLAEEKGPESDPRPPQNATEDKPKRPKQPAHSAPPSAKMSARAHKPIIPNHPEPSPRRSQENLPAAIRSSFFLGEPAPREHAFSARKKEQQQRWREELDKQRNEQNQRKQEEKRLLMSLERDAEGTAWTRHFDTMLPVRNSLLSVDDSAQQLPSVPQQANIAPFPSGALDLRSASDSQVNSTALPPPEMMAPRESGGVSLMNNIYRGEHTTAAPGGGSVNYDQQRTNYLRTMTSLLDPAQIEALEVKRRKQDEHRRAIAAQVEERKRKKEEEENVRKRQEMEEDMRLAAERDVLAQKNETERMKHQMRENVRQQKTQELYHQMQEAQENALRDKLSLREQKLRDRGHDTSRLEKTHQMTLETKKKVGSTSQLVQPSQTSILSTSSSLAVPTMNLPQQGFSTTTTPRQAVTVDDRSPVSVVADTSSGPIKLEITLNNQHNQSDMVETGVQTDVGQGTLDPRQIMYDSDQDTEYLPLPQVRSRKSRPQKEDNKRTDKRNPKQSLQKYERNLGRQYDRFSRTVRNQNDDPNGAVEGGNVGQKKNEKKPQWGVGPKKKEFVPASKRYVDNARWQRKHEANVRRREEQLLEQQAMNNPERLRVIATQIRDEAPEGRRSPPVPTVANRIENTNKNNRRTRSHSPQKGAGQDHRSESPPVPGATRRWQKRDQVQRKRQGRGEANRVLERSESVISATTDQAKYRGNRHTSESPIPLTNDFVEYRRTSTVLNPNQIDSRPSTGVQGNTHDAGGTVRDRPHQRHQPAHSDPHDPLLNPNMVRQRDRQEQILREISILRQGLLLKQREVASYPAAMTHSIAAMPHTSMVLAGGGNLPERTNDTPLI